MSTALAAVFVVVGCAPQQLSPTRQYRASNLSDSSNQSDTTSMDPDAGAPMMQEPVDPLAPRCVLPGEIFGIFTGGVVCPAGMWAACQGQVVECANNCDQLVFGETPEQTTAAGVGHCCYGRNADPMNAMAAQCLRADLTPRCRVEQEDGTFLTQDVPVVCLPAPQPTGAGTPPGGSTPPGT